MPGSYALVCVLTRADLRAPWGSPLVVQPVLALLAQLISLGLWFPPPLVVDRVWVRGRPGGSGQKERNRRVGTRRLLESEPALTLAVTAEGLPVGV